MVAKFKDLEGDEIHPLDLLYQYSSDESSVLTVVAELVDIMPIDEFGNPILSEFQKVAYINSDATKKWNNDLELWNEKNNNTNDSQHESKENEDIQYVYIGELSTENDFINAFELDWNKIDWDWFHIRNNNIKITDIQKITRLHYKNIYTIFLHYCGYGQGK